MYLTLKFVKACKAPANIQELNRLLVYSAVFVKNTIFAHDKINDRVWHCQF